MIRAKLTQELKQAMKAKDAERLSTLRLINAAIKDRDIAARTEDRPEGVSEPEIREILSRMVRQREESAQVYDEAGRIELADQERREIDTIRSFLPRPLSETEVQKAIDAAIAETGATSIRDMGRIISVLKSRHAGRIDFTKAGARVKDALEERHRAAG